MLRTRCYFDMFDKCCAFDLGNIFMTEGSQHQLVDSGLYEFPETYNPLGKTALDLYMFSAIMAG